MHRVHSGRVQGHLQRLSEALLDPGGWNMGTQQIVPVVGGRSSKILKDIFGPEFGRLS